MKKLKFLAFSALVSLNFSASGMQLHKGTDDTLESILGTGNNILLKMSMSLENFKNFLDKEQLEVPVRLFLTDFMSLPTNHPIIDFKAKVNYEFTIPICILPDKPEVFNSYTQFADWLNSGLFANQVRITYDFHVDIQQLAPTLAQQLFAVSPGGYHFKGTHAIDNAAIKPDQCVPQITWSSIRGTTNATTAMLGGIFYLNNCAYPIDTYEQVFPHPIINEITFKTNEKKKFYSYKGLYQSEVTRVTYAEFPGHQVQNWPSAPSGAYSLLRQKLDKLEEISHLACWDGGTGEEVNILDGRVFLVLFEAVNKSEEDPQFVESIVKDDTGNLYTTRYQHSEAEQHRIKARSEAEFRYQLEKEEQSKQEAINHKLAYLMSPDEFVDTHNLKDFWVSGSEKFTAIKVRGNLQYQDLYDLIIHPTRLTYIDWTQSQGISSLAKNIIRLCWDTTLTTLRLNNSLLGEEDAKLIGQGLAQYKALTTLSLWGNKIGDIGAAEIGRGLAQSKILKECDLSSNQIGDIGSAEIGRGLAVNVSLTCLHLQHNKIGDTGATEIGKALARHQQVKQLHLQHNKIGDVGASELGKGLAQSKTLIELDLNYNYQIGDLGAIELGKGLITNTTLTNLDLHVNKIGDLGAVGLGKGLAANTTLTRLSLQLNQIGNSGAAELGKSLRKNTTLTEFILCSNQIGDEGAVELGKCLRSNTTLRNLRLDNNQVGDVGATKLFKGLAANTTLRSFSLGNKVGDRGIADLGKILATNTTLTHLQLFDNQIGNQGAVELAKGLTSNTTLTLLFLYNNHQIGDVGAIALSKGLAQNSTLTNLQISKKNFGDEGIRALRKGWNNRNSNEILF